MDRAKAEERGQKPTFAVPASEWFEVVEMEPGVRVVAEPGHVFSWLIAGSERSLLLDTGLGVADIRAAVQAIGGPPVEVINSHAHFDHIGGNRLFESTAMHPLWSETFDEALVEREVRAYEGLGTQMADDFARLEEIDREGWFLLGPGQRVRQWPRRELERLGGWHIDRPAPARVLAEGDLVDLGDRQLRVIHTPGHCPDHICLLDERSGILFAQDQAYYGPHLINLPESDVETFARSARRLATEVAKSVRSVYVAHCLRPSVPPAFLEELADAAELVAAGEAPLEPTTGLFGERARGADFGHFSILVPA